MFSFGRRPAADESDGEGQPSATAEAAATDRSGSEGGEGEGSSDDGDSGSEESTEQGQGEGESTSEDSDDNPYTRLSPPLEITFHHEEDDEDYLDEDGLSESGDEDSRRPVSIQEFLAWRLLGRVPDAARSRNETRSRYVAFEDAVPRGVAAGGPAGEELAEAVRAATNPLGGVRYGARYDTEWDLCPDASMLGSSTAPYGKRLRQRLRNAGEADPRVMAATQHLGPPAVRAARQQYDATNYQPPAASTPSAAATPQRKRAASGSGDAAADASGGLSCSPGVTTRAAAKRAAAAAASGRGGSGGGSAAGPAGGAAEGPLIPDGFLSGFPAVSLARMLQRREIGCGARGLAGGWGEGQARHVACYQGLPKHPRAVVDSLDSRAYIGQFSDNGQFFVAAFQDRRVRLYDVERGWRLRKDIMTRMCRWTITDTSVSPDQRFVIYSSIIPVVHLVEVGSQYDSVSSIANITQVHEALNFDDSVGTGEDFRRGRSFGIWSVQWSGDGREIVAGTNDQSVVVLDVETRRVVARAEGHDDDVNAVTYADQSPNIIVSGSDDTSIKVWDRRTMPGPPSAESGSGSGLSRPRPVGVLVGHTEGLTHLHSRNDGRVVLSNAKDQCAKIWDLRAMAAGGSLRDVASAARLSGHNVPRFNWDYRWQEYPASGRVVRHPHDTSLLTLRGHSVQHTLIRAYFSPQHTTGQRFVYTGSVEGGVHVYDTVTGQQVEGSPFRLHRKLVRDVSWHPFDPVMATVSWDGSVVRWDAQDPGPDAGAPKVPMHDAYNDYY